MVSGDSLLHVVHGDVTGAGACRNDQATPGSHHWFTITITATPTTDAT